MQTDEIHSREDFERLIGEIDQELQKKDVPIAARAMRALFELSQRTGLHIPIGGQFDFAPVPGDYTGASLAGHIEKWMDDRYGDRLKIDVSYGYTAILLRGDPWLLRIPIIYGQFDVVANRDLSRKFPSWVVNRPGQPQRVFELNVLKQVQGLPQGLASALDGDELMELVEKFLQAHAMHRGLRGNHGDDGLAIAASSDLTSGARRAIGRSDDFGLSRWDSLQAAEKFVKLFLKVRTGKFAKTHKLRELFDDAAKHGLSPPPDRLIDALQCDASVRYEPAQFSTANVVEAHRAAMVVGYEVMYALHPPAPAA